jgi:hypothetical protein
MHMEIFRSQTEPERDETPTENAPPAQQPTEDDDDKNPVKWMLEDR